MSETEILIETQLVDERTAREIIGGRNSPISRATLYRGCADGRFPRPVKIGSGSRWVLAELSQCIAKMIAKRDGMSSEAA
jgi:predicted DNA-binding transcriptional regulator AlpA